MDRRSGEIEDIREMNNWMNKYCERKNDEEETQGTSDGKR